MKRRNGSRHVTTQIEALLDELEEATKAFPGITVDRARQAIDFGERARFRFNSAELTWGSTAAAARVCAGDVSELPAPSVVTGG